jgi:prepilin-type processing-associated H-X9-DG protein
MPFRTAHTLVEIVVVIGILGVVAALTLVGVLRVRYSAMRAECANNMRLIGNALSMYHDQSKTLPPGVVNPLPFSQSGKPRAPYPLMTWHMEILPFAGQDALWKAIFLAYAQDPATLSNPPHTAKEISVPLFNCPADGERPPANNDQGSKPGLTSFLGVSGIRSGRCDGVFYLDSRTRFADVSDGLANTIAVGERPPTMDRVFGRWHASWGGPWGDLNSYMGTTELASGSYSDDCSPGPYSFRAGRLADPCSAYHFWSLHSSGGNFLFSDGSVRFITYSAAAVMPALATRAGGEVVNVD